LDKKPKKLTSPKTQKPHKKPAVTFLLAEPVFVTFPVTLSGVVIAGVGSAFWGVAVGAFALFVQQYGQERRAPLAGAVQTTMTSRSLKNP